MKRFKNEHLGSKCWVVCLGVSIDVKSSPYIAQRKRLARERMWSEKRGKNGALLNTDTVDGGGEPTENFEGYRRGEATLRDCAPIERSECLRREIK